VWLLPRKVFSLNLNLHAIDPTLHSNLTQHISLNFGWDGAHKKHQGYFWLTLRFRSISYAGVMSQITKYYATRGKWGEPHKLEDRVALDIILKQRRFESTNHCNFHIILMKRLNANFSMQTIVNSLQSIMDHSCVGIIKVWDGTLFVNDMMGRMVIAIAAGLQ